MIQSAEYNYSSTLGFSGMFSRLTILKPQKPQSKACQSFHNLFISPKLFKLCKVFSVLPKWKKKEKLPLYNISITAAKNNISAVLKFQNSIQSLQTFRKQEI